ncbi:hypothetical protein [Pseudomonas sp.]|uniref:hypothetical protein n=1 Tax=Pseudomonas sp. TaxID=306 RepID=UPI003FD78439
MELVKHLARVSSASLEIKDRGMLNFWVNVDYEEGCSQGVGGIALDSYDKSKEHRVGTAYGCEMIRQVLNVFNVNDFSEMNGKLIYVLGDGEGLGFNPCGFERLNLDKKYKKDDVCNFKEIYKQFGEEK